MALVVPIVRNYKQRRSERNCPSVTLQKLEADLKGGRRSKGGHRSFSERLQAADMLKPYIDVDVPCERAQCAELRQKLLELYLKALLPLCPEKQIAISERVRADKVSLHFTLNGAVCRADRMLACLSSVARLQGFDPKAYVSGGERVWTMVYCSKPGEAEVLQPLTHKDDLSKHLVHYTSEEELAAAERLHSFVDEPDKSEPEPQQPSESVPQQPSEPQLSLPVDIRKYIEDNFWLGLIKSKQECNEHTRKIARKEITETVFSTVWYCCVGHVCPIHQQLGQTVTHDNHAYVMVRQRYKDAEDQSMGIRGEITAVQLQCHHSGRVFPRCTNPVDVTAEACGYAQSLRQCKVWNEFVAFVAVTSSYIYTAAGREPVPVRSRHDVQDIMAPHTQMPIEKWIKHKGRKTYHCTDFFPSLDPDVLPRRFRDGSDLNLFRGYTIPRQKAVKGDARPVLDHLLRVWCNGRQAEYEYLLNWLAQVVQKPWDRTHICLVLVSKEGAGKGIIVSLLFRILGRQCCLSEARKSNIFGDFNEALSCKTLVVLNELLWAGSHECGGIFKDMITDTEISINQKHQPHRVETCFQNYIVCTNNAWAVPASMEARRFFVLEPSEEYAGTQTEPKRAYFERIAAVAPEALAHVLYNRDISKFKPEVVPRTEGLLKQIMQSLTGVESALFDCLRRGYIFPPEYSTKYWVDQDYCTGFGVHIRRQHLRQILIEDYGKDYGFPSSPQSFWAAIMDVCTNHTASIFEETGRMQRTQTRDGLTTKVRDYWVRFASLERCREFWNEHRFRFAFSIATTTAEVENPLRPRLGTPEVRPESAPESEPAPKRPRAEVT